MVKVRSSPSSSVAVTLPIDVWFSSALKVVLEVNTGELSFTFVTLTVISWVAELSSVSTTVTVAE